MRRVLKEKKERRKKKKKRVSSWLWENKRVIQLRPLWSILAVGNTDTLSLASL